MSWKQIKREGIVVKFRKLLAMVLAVAMIASLAPVLRTTAKADALEDNALKGATSSSEYQFNFSFSKPIISEVGSDKYISRTITITNIGQAVTNSSNDDGKRIKIHIFNTNDSTFTSDFPSADRLPEKGGGKDGNVNYYPYAVSKSNNDATIEFSDSSHDIYIKNPTRTDASGEYIFFDENETITIEVRHKYKKGDENKTLVNFIALYIPQKNKGDTFDYGHEIGSTSEGTVDNVVNSTPPPTGTLTVTSKLADGSTENPGTITYTVTGTEIKSTGSYGDGVTPSDGSLTFTLSPTNSTGVSKALTLPEGSYTVSQSEVTGWTTANEASNGSVSGGITVSAAAAATATFTLTKTPTTPAGTKVTYHLNIPNDNDYFSGKTGMDYVYYDETSDYILELWEISKFTYGRDDIEGVSIVDQENEASDAFTSYPNGYLGKVNSDQRYYFVGWSTKPDDVYNENSNNFSHVKYPVVYLAGHKDGENGYAIRGIYGYPSDFVYNTPTAQTPKFSNADDSDLYAVWVKSDSHAGLMGYTMQIPDGDFPGARADHTVGNMFTGASRTGQKLGINGMGGSNTWHKYTVLDQGYKQRDEFKVTSNEPQYYGNDVAYKNGDQKVTNFVTWKLKNAGKTEKGVKDENQYIANPGDTVKYFGNYSVYSLDAVWATVTAPDKQIVGYNGNPQYPNMEQLKTAFNGADSNQDIFKTLFATDNRFASASPATNAYLTYSFEITKDGENVTPTGTSGVIPGVTEPGVYKYTIKAHYKVESTESVSGKTVGRAVDKDIGTVSFLFIIQPRLTLNVTKSLTGRAWKSDDSFTFTVSVTGGTGATVETGTLTINESGDHKASTYVNFTAAGEYTITIHETTTSEPGMTYAADQTVKITATVDSNGFITLTNVSGTTVGTDGNATAAVTMTNAYNTGSLTITKEVKPDTTSKGDGKDFTITVTLTKGEFPETLSTDIVGTATATRTSATVVTLSLQKGASVTIKDLPVGAEYTVVETEAHDADKVEYSVNSGAAETSCAGKIIAAGNNNVTVTNTYPAPTGKLTITKTVTGTNAPSEWSFEFTVKAPTGVTFDAGTSYPSGVTRTDDTTLTVTLKNDAASVTIENLPIGTYTVTEDVPAGYEFNVTGDNVTRTSGENAFTAAITEDGTTTAAVTNTFLTGDLKITKTVTGTNAPSEWSFEFTVKATDGTIPDGSYGTDVLYNPSDGTLTVTVNQGNTDGVTVTNLPIGTYTVVEDTSGLTNYGTPTYSNDANTAGVTVTKDGTATVTVTNHYDQPTGSLTITKTVEGVASASGQVFTFTVTAPAGKIADDTSFGSVVFNDNQATVTITMDNTGLTKSVTIAGLPTGYYKVEENTADLSDYNTTYAPDDAPSTGVNVTEGGTAIATVTNTHKTGNLTIRKTVTGSGPAVPTNGTFTFTITAPDGLIAAGTAFNLGGAAGTVTFTDGKTAEVKITTASKEGSVTIENLPIGTYTVTEAKVDGYKADAETKSVTLTTSGATAAFTNTFLTGDLTINKTVTGTNAPASDTFTFTVKATGDTVAKVANKTFDSVHFGSDGSATVTITTASKEGSVTIENLPIGNYTVEETAKTHYTQSPTSQPVNVTTGGGTAEFTNEYVEPGSLTVKKNVVGTTTTEDFNFTVTFTGWTPSADWASENGVTLDGNSVKFTLKKDASKTLENIPDGTSYTVTEDKITENPPTKTTYSAGSGAITTGKEDTVTVTNFYTGSLTISKEVTGKNYGGGTLVFTVKAPDDVTLDENAAYYGATSKDSDNKTLRVSIAVDVNTKKGSVTLNNLPAGEYTVTELLGSNTNFTETSMDGTVKADRETKVTIESGKTKTLEVINKYAQPTGSLTVKKTVMAGKDKATGNKDFEFTVEFGNIPRDGFTLKIGATEKEITSTNNTAPFTVSTTNGEGSVTLSGIPENVTYKVTETPDANYISTPKLAEGKIAANRTDVKEFINYKKSTLSITKVLQDESGDTNLPTTVKDKEFHFAVNFSSVLGSGEYTVTVKTPSKTFTQVLSAQNAKVEFDLKGGETCEISGLPVGVHYEINEELTGDDVYHYTPDVTSGSRVSTVAEAGSSVTYTNTYSEITLGTGSLILQKGIEGVNNSGSDSFTFKVTYTKAAGVDETLWNEFVTSEHLEGDGSKTYTVKVDKPVTIRDIPAGTNYTVEEVGAVNVRFAVGNLDGREGGFGINETAKTVSGTINSHGDNDTVTIYNQYLADLKITKKVTHSTSAQKPADDVYFVFEVEFGGTNYEGVQKTVSDSDGENREAVFENDKILIRLKAGDTATFPGVDVGTTNFRITEVRIEDKDHHVLAEKLGDKITYQIGTGGSPVDITASKSTGVLAFDEETEVIITNEYNVVATGRLTITKAITDESGASHTSDEYTFEITRKEDNALVQTVTITGAGSQSVTLDVGDYIVTETTEGLGKEFAATYKWGTNGNSEEEADVTITAGTSVEVTVTNTYNPGSLTITKAITDDSGASHANDKFTFTITKKGESTPVQTVEITGAGSKTVSLPAGDYVVTETAGKGDSVAYRVGTSGSSAANAEVTITAGGTVAVTVTNTYYSGGGTGGTGGGTGGTPSPDIDTSEHYGYIIGVTHTEVAPEQNITRAEIATILFRLLTDEARAANWSENSGFPDVKSGVWYNHAVAALHKMGIILGDDNGNFNPDQNITRAEVAAMVVRFYEVAEGTVLNNRFTDVETTKWYAEAVLLADYYGLMQGDGDTFKPEDLLTRAEAMTVFNRLLGRKPHKDHLHKDMITWTDNTDRNKWYYAEVQEATNSHTCGNNVVIDGKIYETWSAITKMRDWAALEY